MVAVVDPAVAPKNSPSAIGGLALEPLHQGGGIETMWFGPGRHVIGSSADCSHSLRNDGVQPRHCEIRIEAGHVTLRALDFRTWLNNGPVRQAELRSGDRLIVGPLEFRVSFDANAPTVSPTIEQRPIAAPVVAAPPVSAAVQSPAPVIASPDFIVQALRRNTEMEERLAQLEEKLSTRSRDSTCA